MPLTNAQTISFFETASQMAIPRATVQQMMNEGIGSVDDLSEFTKESIDNLASSLRKTLKTAPETGHFILGAKSQKRLTIAAEAVRYYETVDRPLCAANMKWNQVLSNFEIQWKSVTERSKKDPPETPKITKGTTVMKWSEAFKDHCHQYIGARNIALAYVIRDDSEVPEDFPDQGTTENGTINVPHAEEYGSIDAELITRANHDHPLFRVDNETVYMELEKATRSTQYAAAISPHQRRKDGRNAWLAIISQFAGKDKWEAELKFKEEILHTWKWKGSSSYKLELFASQHRAAFVSMEQCAQHIEYQLPNEHSRVKYLLTAIECGDAELQAAMAMVRADGSMRSNFEAAVAHLLPSCPVARKKRDNKRKGADISSSEAHNPNTANISSFGTKQGKGRSTGVQLRYHTSEEYQKLSHDQRKELDDWRKTTNTGKYSKNKKPKTKQKKVAFAAAVEKKVSERLKNIDDDAKTTQDFEAFIMSCIKKSNPGQPTSQPTNSGNSAAVNASSTSAKSVLQAIINRAKNAPSNP